MLDVLFPDILLVTHTGPLECSYPRLSFQASVTGIGTGETTGDIAMDIHSIMDITIVATVGMVVAMGDTGDMVVAGRETKWSY